MSHPEEKIPLIVILGPTAVGKTKLAIELAQSIGGEIISADSRLFYRGMDIGTAKPSRQELHAVPHHLIDISDPDERWSVARFQDETNRIVKEISGRGNLPLLVGGTGQYLRAVTQGWQVPELPPNKSLRAALNRWAEEIGPQELYKRLAVIDPEAATKILPQNVRRTVRAFEVIFHTGKLFSAMKKKGEVPYSILQIGLIRPREILYQRVDQRLELMIREGFVDEVKRLLSMGYHKSLPSMSAIGYAQIAAHLEGDISLEDAVKEIRRITRVFIRRQRNWFKPDDPEINWFDLEIDGIDEIRVCVEDFLAQSRK